MACDPSNPVHDSQKLEPAQCLFHSLEEVKRIQPREFDGLGQHLLIDFYDCTALPTSASQLEQAMLKTAERIKATVVTSSFHKFNPQGLSGVVVIAESHLAAHTWPEHQAICIDLFTCSKGMDSVAGLVYLFQEFGAGSMTINTVCRGKRI